MLTPVEGLKEIATLDQSVRRIMQALPTWEEDALVELYRQSTVLEERSLIVRAAVVAEFVRRLRGEAKRLPSGAWLRIAQALGEKKRNVWFLYRIWEEILSRLGPDEDLNLPQRLYETALRAKKYGIDPLDAARHASYVRNVLDPHYSRENFLEDIRAGLPDPENRPQKEKAPCLSCPHYQAAEEGVALALVRFVGEEANIEVLALSSEGEGTRYCGKYALMGKDLLVFRWDCPEKGELCASADRPDREESGLCNSPLGDQNASGDLSAGPHRGRGP